LNKTYAIIEQSYLFHVDQYLIIIVHNLNNNEAIFAQCELLLFKTCSNILWNPWMHHNAT